MVSDWQRSSPEEEDKDEEEEEEEEEGDVKSVLGSLCSLEDALPVKRGLSNCFSGKCKSFASLADAAALGSAAGLSKAEHPFNKRLRMTMKYRTSWRRRQPSGTLIATRLDGIGQHEEARGDQFSSFSSSPKILYSGFFLLSHLQPA